jgi:RTX calcium-binding nonapeptide repeat (4 copies)/WD40-like Beta Propeller Repeat
LHPVKKRLALLVLGLVVVLLAAGQLAHALAGPGPADPQDTNPYWAGDGVHVAFQRTSPAGANVLEMTSAGKELAVVGRGLALRGFVPGTTHLLVQTEDETRVVTGSRFDGPLATIDGVDATASPDGTRVAYFRDGELFVSRIDGSGERQLAAPASLPNGDLVGPAWSPGGAQVAIASASGLLVAASDGSSSKEIVSGPVASPSWSPDGSTIAYESRVPPHDSIRLVDAGGTNDRLLAGGVYQNRLPQFSPVSNRVAFLSNRKEILPQYRLYLQDASSTVAHALVDDVDPASPPRWSPTAALIAVAARQECRRGGIYTVRSAIGSRPARHSNRCRLDGTAHGDRIVGTQYFDIVNGLGGNDVIKGNGGNDKLSGDNGDDTLFGGIGNDFILAGPGNDTVYGGPGNDTIIPGNGRDRIDCGPGIDTVEGVGPLDRIARNCETVKR